MSESERLKHQLRDYRWLFDTADTAMIIIDHDGTYLDYNRAYYRLMGYTEKTKLEKYHPANVSPAKQPNGQDSFKMANEMISRAMSEGKHSFEWMHKRPDGFEFLSHVVLDVIDFDDRKCIRAVIYDISESKKLERIVEERTSELAIKNKELKHLAVTDRLTGLYNRIHLDEMLHQELQRFERFHRSFGIVLLDVDHFKKVNDNYGHHIGDQVLIDIANILKQHCRKVDTICRWGGEEFLIVSPESNLDGIHLLAEKLRTKIESHIFTESISVTSSFGCGIYKEDDSISELFTRVDCALYKAKTNGRNQVEIAS